MKTKEASFTTSLNRFDSNLWHFHIIVEKKIAEKVMTKESRRVVCTLLQTTSFQGALMPYGDGNYFINVNNQLRKKLKLNDGDNVQVHLTPDTSKYGLPLPPEFEELLKQDIAGSDLFEALTDGKKRTLLFIVGKPKSPDLRIRNGIAILEHLKRNKGKIDYKQLNSDMRNFS
jgi:translation initiation factor IF-1